MASDLPWRLLSTISVTDIGQVGAKFRSVYSVIVRQQSNPKDGRVLSECETTIMPMRDLRPKVAGRSAQRVRATLSESEPATSARPSVFN